MVAQKHDRSFLKKKVVSQAERIWKCNERNNDKRSNDSSLWLRLMIKIVILNEFFKILTEVYLKHMKVSKEGRFHKAGDSITRSDALWKGAIPVPDQNRS